MTGRHIEVTLTIVRDEQPITVIVRVEWGAPHARLVPETTGRNDGADYHLTTTEQNEARRAAAERLRASRMTN